MIKLYKQSVPKEIEDLWHQWSTQYLERLETGKHIPENLVKRYKNPKIKQQLISETNGKCAYCESKVTPVYPGDVEHIKPKSKFPELTLNYDNLTFACFQCNNKKSDYYRSENGVINPFEDNPDDFIFAFGILVLSYPGNSTGTATVLILDLNRPELVERRKEKLDAIALLAEKCEQLDDPTLIFLLKKLLLSECDDDREYTMVARSYLEKIIKR